jgi:hypothetical protein
VGVSQLQLVNLYRNRRYFVIKLHTWFCLSYFLKTNIKCYCIYQYFMSINSFFNTVSVSPYSRPISNETSHVTTHATHSDPWPSLARSTSLFLILCCYNKSLQRYVNEWFLYEKDPCSLSRIYSTSEWGKSCKCGRSGEIDRGV